MRSEKGVRRVRRETERTGAAVMKGPRCGGGIGGGMPYLLSEAIYRPTAVGSRPKRPAGRPPERALHGNAHFGETGSSIYPMSSTALTPDFPNPSLKGKGQGKAEA